MKETINKIKVLKFMLDQGDITHEEQKELNKLIQELVYDKFETKHKAGFTPQEEINIVSDLDLNINDYYHKLGVNTCMMINGEFITYHCDVIKGITCVLENRNQNLLEFD